MPQVRAAQETRPSTVVTATESDAIAETNISPFRRIFVPADRPSDWPTNGDRYIPIDKSEFSQLLDDVRAGDQAAPGHLAARIERANYSIRVVGEDLLVGTAEFDIVHNSSQTALRPLMPWSVAVSTAHWERENSIRG